MAIKPVNRRNIHNIIAEMTGGLDCPADLVFLLLTVNYPLPPILNLVVNVLRYLVHLGFLLAHKASTKNQAETISGGVFDDYFPVIIKAQLLSCWTDNCVVTALC